MDEKEVFRKKEEAKLDESVTLPDSGVESSNIELNSTAVPTPEQEEDSGIENSESNEQEPETSEIVTQEREELTPEQESVEKMLTQSQVNEIVGKTRSETRDKTEAETLNKIYSRYGVKNEADLDEVFGRAQKYDLIREEYDSVSKKLEEAKERLAMFDSGIDPNRYEDARLILRGKGLEVTSENLTKEMATHPEWKKSLPLPNKANDEVAETFRKVEVVKKPISEISVLGNNRVEKTPEIDEKKETLEWYR